MRAKTGWKDARLAEGALVASNVPIVKAIRSAFPRALRTTMPS